MQLTYFPFKSKFRYPVSHGAYSRTHTQSIVVKLEENMIGFGEGTPREYATGESLEECLYELSKLPSTFQASRARELIDAVEKPSVKCALECAYLDWKGKTKKKSVKDLLSTADFEFNYSAVVPIDPPDIVYKLIKSYDLDDIKIKVSPITSLEEILKVHSLFPKASIRLDANGSLTLEQALQLLKSLQDQQVPVRAFEEPTVDPDNFFKIEEESGIPVIADESFQFSNALEILKSPPCSGLNFRLSKLGGPTELLKMVEHQPGVLKLFGSHVGETSILSALQFHTARSSQFDFVEGGYSQFVLITDLGNFPFHKKSSEIQLAPDGLGIMSWQK